MRSFRKYASSFATRKSKGRRRYEKERGVASAVAVLFMILLFVAALNTFVLTTVPQQMSALEYQHTLQVENQFVQFQSDVYLEAEHPSDHVSIINPVQLGSAGFPPFAVPSTSTLYGNPSGSLGASYATPLGGFKYEYPRWGINVTGGTCSTSGYTFSCSNTNPGEVVYANVTANGTSGSPIAVGIDLTGCHSASFCWIDYNVLGSYLDITVTATGPELNYTIVTVEGNHDALKFIWTGSTAATGSVINFIFYGENNSMDDTAGPSGSAPLSVDTYFIGWTSGSTSCPVKDVASGDTFTGATPSSAPMYQNVTWYNDIGLNNLNTYTISSGGHVIYAQFQNTSGTIGCAWVHAGYTSYPLEQGAGIEDALNNRYFPAETVSYEEGAVILGNPATNMSEMISGPQMEVTGSPSDYTVSLELVQFAYQNLSAITGQGYGWIQSEFLHSATASFSASNPTEALGNPQYLNITTPFPEAWITWASQYPDVFETGGHIIGKCGIITSGGTCKVEIPVTDENLVLETITASVSIG